MAIDKTKLTGVEKVYPLNVSPYEQYMGDFQNPSVVSKINAMIQSLHQIGRLTNETVSQWNNVMKWIVEGGMDEIAETVTNEKVSVALEEVMRMLDVSLNNGLKELAENVSDNKIDELLESGQFESMVQTSLVEINEVVENKLDGFNLRLAEKAEQIDLDNKAPRLPYHLSSKIKNKVNFPDEWTWTEAPITIYRGADGTISTDFEVSEFEHIGNGKTYYLKMPSQGGSANNDGLTPETPKSSMNQIFQAGDADIIFVGDGYYDFGSGTNQTNINKNISIKALNGNESDVTISTNATLNFSKTTGYTNVYNASRTLVGSVFDGEELIEGDMTKLEQVGSIGEVDTTQGSYYYATPDLYIHPLKSRIPDGKIKVFLNIYNLRNTGNHVTYSENIRWHGGSNGSAYISTSTTGENTLFVAKNCEFKYSNDGSGGLTALGCDVYLQNCVASSNTKDGFNYHIQNGRINKVIEVDCKSYLNGKKGSYQDQASSMHDGGKIIRINVEYFKNHSANITDVSSGTESWNLGCNVHSSITTVDSANANYSIETGKMWLDSCIGYDSKKAYRSLTGATLHTKNCLFDDGERDIRADMVEY